MDQITVTDKGLYCPPGGFHIDPWGPVDRAVVTVVHQADHRGIDARKLLVTGDRVDPAPSALDRLRRRAVDRAEAEMAASLKVARFGDPQEVANVVAFLASDRAAYCHGAVIDVDGGLTRTL